ncbi:hypothetical protein [Fischerella thermalis]
MKSSSANCLRYYASLLGIGDGQWGDEEMVRWGTRGPLWGLGAVG